LVGCVVGSVVVAWLLLLLLLRVRNNKKQIGAERSPFIYTSFGLLVPTDGLQRRHQDTSNPVFACAVAAVWQDDTQVADGVVRL
jgi:hypothetical protein